jgi:hypothetical protein
MPTDNGALLRKAMLSDDASMNWFAPDDASMNWFAPSETLAGVSRLENRMSRHCTSR